MKRHISQMICSNMLESIVFIAWKALIGGYIRNGQIWRTEWKGLETGTLIYKKVHFMNDMLKYIRISCFYHSKSPRLKIHKDGQIWPFQSKRLKTSVKMYKEAYFMNNMLKYIKILLEKLPNRRYMKTVKFDRVNEKGWKWAL